jgi:hypothetical protein
VAQRRQHDLLVGPVALGPGGGLEAVGELVGREAVDDLAERLEEHQDAVGDPDAREKHRDTLTPEEWALAEQFADEWDQAAFDPDYDTLPLEHFEPKIRKVFGQSSPIGKQSG